LADSGTKDGAQQYFDWFPTMQKGAIGGCSISLMKDLLAPPHDVGRKPGIAEIDRPPSIAMGGAFDPS
jgi:hypothetical protein